MELRNCDRIYPEGFELQLMGEDKEARAIAQRHLVITKWLPEGQIARYKKQLFTFRIHESDRPLFQQIPNL